MRVVIIGAAGQLGQALVETFVDHDVLTPSHAIMDISHSGQTGSYIALYKPDLVINTAAFHDVARCEEEDFLAFQTNTLGPRILAQACRQVGAMLVHVSTDYVFDGKKGQPYNEIDMPAPLNIYGRTKLDGECQALENNEKTYIVRTTGLFGSSPCRAKPGGRNFVKTMLHMAETKGKVDVVDDQFCCPTYVIDLAEQIRTMAEAKPQYGIYHAVNSPGCSWYDFAKLIFDQSGTKVELQSTKSKVVIPNPIEQDRSIIQGASEEAPSGCKPPEQPFSAVRRHRSEQRSRMERAESRGFGITFQRPVDSRLDNAALKSLGLLQMRTLSDALADYLGIISKGPFSKEVIPVLKPHDNLGL